MGDLLFGCFIERKINRNTRNTHGYCYGKPSVEATPTVTVQHLSCKLAKVERLHTPVTQVACHGEEVNLSLINLLLHSNGVYWVRQQSGDASRQSTCPNMIPLKGPRLHFLCDLHWRLRHCSKPNTFQQALKKKSTKAGLQIQQLRDVLRRKKGEQHWKTGSKIEKCWENVFSASACYYCSRQESNERENQGAKKGIFDSLNEFENRWLLCIPLLYFQAVAHPQCQRG